MAGSVDLLERCFAGVETRGETLILNPYWPSALGVLELDVRYRHHRLRLRVTDESVQVSSAAGDQRSIRVHCHGQVVTVHPGSTIQFNRSGSLPGQRDDPQSYAWR